MLEQLAQFVKGNEEVMVLIAVFPIVIFRIGFNIIVYNKVHDTNYIPMFQNLQKGGWQVNIYCTYIFWWFNKEQDSKEVIKYKKYANSISIASILIFGISVCLLVLSEYK